MKIFCSGIGGIGLSAYAALQKLNGHDVSGSDRSKTALTEDLESQGISVMFDQSGAAMPEDTELLVYSEALPVDAPERMKAKQLGIRSLSYPAAVGELSKGYKLIAICGSHGKSSTTGMAARLLLEAGIDPTIIIGTKIRELNGRNWHKGSSGVFLLEACEYRRSFLNYHPEVILLTNADGDHFDYFKSMEDYHHAFEEFVKKLPEGGAMIYHGGDQDSSTIASKSHATQLDADDQELIELKTPGLHMRKNAQLVLALAKHLGIDSAKAKSIVSGYAGSWRRLEIKGETTNGITVIDDYAHHPVEIRASLAALKEAYAEKRIVVAFQPHTHDRTLKLYKEFLESFTDADLVLVPNVYDARHDTETVMVDIEKFCSDLQSSSGHEVRYTKDLATTEQLLKNEILKEGDILVCMGAGDITNLAQKMIA